MVFYFYESEISPFLNKNKQILFFLISQQVGIIHVESSKPTITFNPFCGKPIYSIDWQNDHIFVVSNDILAVYDVNSEQKGKRTVCTYIYLRKNIYLNFYKDNNQFVRCPNGKHSFCAFMVPNDKAVCCERVCSFRMYDRCMVSR